MTERVSDDVLQLLAAEPDKTTINYIIAQAAGVDTGIEFIRSIARELLAARAKIAELEAAQAWRPIQTAPKDGTEILLVGPYDTPGIARWVERHKEWRAAFCGTDTIDHMGDFGTEYKTYGVPSHWLPLPAPPKDAAT